MERRGTAEAEVRVIRFESHEAERVFRRFPEDVAEPSKLRSKNEG